jgi:hypothetical protein
VRAVGEVLRDPVVGMVEDRHHAKSNREAS